VDTEETRGDRSLFYVKMSVKVSVMYCGNCVSSCGSAVGSSLGEFQISSLLMVCELHHSC
jgi:hypothetical protein